MYWKSLFFVMMIGLLALACNRMKYQRTESGLQYRILHRNKGARLAKVGDIMKLRVQSFVSGRPLDKLPAFTRYIPYTIELQREHKKQHSMDRYRFNDIFALLREGDSLWVRVPMDSVFYDQLQKPPFFMPAQYIASTIKLEKLMTEEEWQQEEQQAMRRSSQKEYIEISQFVRKKKLKGKVQNGVFLCYKTWGKGGKATQGDIITFRYKGQFLNGTVFDSTRKDQKPLSFQLGSSSLIEGFSRVLEGVCAGAQFQCIIPSALAYGAQGAGSVIPPNTPLHFYIQVEKVQKKKT